METKRWTITQTTTGVDLGTYTGRTAAEALDAYARDMGAADFAALCSIYEDGSNGGARTLRVEAVEDEPEIAECIYCGRDSTLAPVPAAADDDDAWAALAAEHAPTCEWVRTRAHRREAQ